VVAKENFATAILPSKNCISGSLPRLPINITLLIPLIFDKYYIEEIKIFI
jgi:hypothetical protein